MHKFTFTYYGWIPSYRDFDQDDYECSAKTMQDAWADFNKHVKFVKSAALTHIDGKAVKKDNLPVPTQEGKLSLDIKKLVREEVKKAINEDATSFVKTFKQPN